MKARRLPNLQLRASAPVGTPAASPVAFSSQPSAGRSVERPAALSHRPPILHGHSNNYRGHGNYMPDAAVKLPAIEDEAEHCAALSALGGYHDVSPQELRRELALEDAQRRRQQRATRNVTGILCGDPLPGRRVA